MAIPTLQVGSESGKGGTLYTVSRAAISAATASTHELVSAVAGKQIVVLGMKLISAGQTTATLKSGSTALTGEITLTAGSGFIVPIVDNPAVAPFVTAAGEALNMTLSAAVQVSGWIVYVAI